MKKVRIIIDILMTVLLPLLMAYSLIGENVHEVLGVCMFALFAAHHILNRKWWTTLFRGKYTPARALNTAVNLLLAVFMILQPLSGILMSKFVLKGLTIPGAASLLRGLHMALAYCGFLLMSFHLGLHAGTFTAKMKKRMRNGLRVALTAALLLIAAYGVYAFIKRGIGAYLLLQVQFAFFDFSEARVWFFLDYAAIIVLAAVAAFWLQHALRKGNSKSKERTA